MRSNAIVVVLLLASFCFVKGLAIADDIPRICTNASSDIDGDGWGWEQQQSCTVEPIELNVLPECSGNNADADGDGYGWENNQSCIAPPATDNANPVYCKFTSSDPDGDGFGYENNRSCKMSDRHFVDVPISTSLGNPKPLTLGETITATSDGVVGRYYLIDVPSNQPVSITIGGRVAYLNVYKNNTRISSGNGVSRFTSSTATTHHCLPAGSYIIELIRSETYTLKAEQTLLTPCANPSSLPDLDQKWEHNNIRNLRTFSYPFFTLNGLNNNEEVEWSYTSDQIISSYKRGDDGLIYVYLERENEIDSRYKKVDLHILDPDGLATDLQLSMAQPSSSVPVCLDSSSDQDGDGWGYENEISCLIDSQTIIEEEGDSIVHPGDTLSGTLDEDSDGEFFYMTLNQSTPLTFRSDKTGTAHLFLRDTSNLSRRYFTITSRIIDSQQTDGNFNLANERTVCIPAGTYQIGIAKHLDAPTAEFAYSIEHADIRCIQPIHAATPFPNFRANNFHVTNGAPTSSGLIFQVYENDTQRVLRAVDWQGNPLWDRTPEGWLDYQFEVTDSAVHVLSSVDFRDTVTSYSITGEELWSRQYKTTMNLFSKNNIVLLHGRSAIEAYDPTGTPLWLHSPLLNIGYSNQYYEHLTDTEMVIQ